MKPIGTFDIETDPFEFGKMVEPFCCGFYDGKSARTWWGKNALRDCAQVMKKFPGYIYAHNGGKFDFVFLAETIGHKNLCNPKTKEKGQPLMIKSRIAAFSYGEAEFRDSWLLVPTPLRDFCKDEIDYNKLRKENRDEHRDEILRYLRSDLLNLHSYVSAMIAENGFGLTIAGRTFDLLKKNFGLKPFRASENYDDTFRRFYYGGRCEFFKLGFVPGPVVCVDINSAYPHAMLAEHPFDLENKFSTRLPKRQSDLEKSFAIIDAQSDGILPVRAKDGAISFPHTTGEFFATGWEIIAGLKLNKLKIHNVKAVYTFAETKNFSDYVRHYYAARQDAKTRGDKTADLLNKLVLNSLYGRFALNPREHRDIQILDYDENPNELVDEDDNGEPIFSEEWELITEFPEKGFSVWGRKKEIFGNAFFNVATACSITGKVRAYLAESLANVKNPVYCDTDSIFAADTGKLPLGPKLGDWKIDDEFPAGIYIAGKKLYAGKGIKGWKTAHKGVNLSPREIIEIALGKEKITKFDAPNISLVSNVRWIQRRVVRDDQRKKNNQPAK